MSGSEYIANDGDEQLSMHQPEKGRRVLIAPALVHQHGGPERVVKQKQKQGGINGVYGLAGEVKHTAIHHLPPLPLE